MRNRDAMGKSSREDMKQKVVKKNSFGAEFVSTGKQPFGWKSGFFLRLRVELQKKWGEKQMQTNLEEPPKQFKLRNVGGGGGRKRNFDKANKTFFPR